MNITDYHSKQSDLLFGSTTKKWLRFEKYTIENDSIKAAGDYEEYSPFNEFPGIMTDFLELCLLVDNLNSAQNNLLNMQRVSKKAKNNVDKLEKDLMEQYRIFSLKYGLLGVGISRIKGVSFRTIKTVNVIGEPIEETSSFSSPQHYIISEKPDPLFRDTWLAYSDDSLPEQGGLITVKEFNNAYGGSRFPDYRETLAQLMDCEIIWDILDDMKSLKDGQEKRFCFSANKVCVTTENGIPEISWHYNSLIQALSIMYASNKIGRFDVKVFQCPTCGKINVSSNSLKKYCDDWCLKAMIRRNQRKKQKEKQKERSDQ